MTRAAALLVAAVSILPVPARAFVRSVVPGTDTCLFWNGRTLPWSPAEAGTPELSPDRTVAAFRTSFEAWEAVDCSDVAFAERAPSASRDAGFVENRPNENLLLFRAELCRDVVDDDDGCWEAGSCANRHDCWDFSDRAIAVTTTTFARDTGRIVDADIEFNAAGFRFTDADGRRCTSPSQPGCVSTDLQNTATHEIGHLLGLDHTGDPDATMYDSAPEGETKKRSLGSDDIDGLCTVYPAGEDTAICVARSALDGGGCGCTSAGADLALLALPPLAWLLRRRGLPGRRTGA